jgi:hypothetical protein
MPVLFTAAAGPSELIVPIIIDDHIEWWLQVPDTAQLQPCEPWNGRVWLVDACGRSVLQDTPPSGLMKVLANMLPHLLATIGTVSI